MRRALRMLFLTLSSIIVGGGLALIAVTIMLYAWQTLA